jgi:hypothetical protein
MSENRVAGQRKAVGIVDQELAAVVVGEWTSLLQIMLALRYCLVF